MRKKRMIGKWALLLILLAVITGSLVFFEWLGSEQPQKIVELPVKVPAITDQAGKEKAE